MSKRALWIQLPALASLTLLLACGSPAEQAPPPPAPPTPLRVGYIPIADCGQLMVALAGGNFTSRHISIAPTSMAGGAPILEALGAGSLDLGFSNLVSLILAHEAGLPFVALTGGPVEDREHREHAILVAPGSPLARIEDLAGKTIALNTRKNIDELMVVTLLQEHGVAATAVRFVEIPFPRMLAALGKGDVAAVAAIEPFVTIGTTTGTARVLSYNYIEVQPLTPISTYVVTRDWLHRNPGIAAGFAAALSEATAATNRDPAAVRAALAKYVHLDPAYLRQVVLPAYTQGLSRQQLGDLIRRVHEMGWIRTIFDPAEILAEKPRGPGA
jgi:NitT/TauT family transport system substrate-binding protein